METNDLATKMRKGWWLDQGECRRAAMMRYKTRGAQQPQHPDSPNSVEARQSCGGTALAHAHYRSPRQRFRMGLSVITVLCLSTFSIVSGRVPAPQNLTAEVFGNLMIKFSWEPPEGWDPRTVTDSTLDQYKTYVSEGDTDGYYSLATLTYFQNFQYVSTPFIQLPGTRYYFRVMSVTCCSLFRFQGKCASARTEGTTCESSATSFHCTTTDGVETCHYPTDGYAETSIVAMAEPEAPDKLSVLLHEATGAYPGSPQLNIQWNLPNDTGTNQRQRADVLGFKVLRATDLNFTVPKQIFYGLPVPSGDSEDTYRYQIIDADSLVTGLTYFYRVYVQNAACGPMNVTCSPYSVASRNASGYPSEPTQFVGDLLDSTRIQLDWQAPQDTGQGAGVTSSNLEPITGYRIEEDFCQPAGGCEVTGSNRRQLYSSNDASTLTFLKTGIDAAYTFVFYIQAKNGAGFGPFESVQVISLFFPSAPQNFTASIIGPLQVQLSWAIPDNTGQGPNDQTEPITGYKLHQSDRPSVFNDSNSILLQTGMQLSFTITFSQKRISPYYFMVQAANQLGYGDNKTLSAFVSEYAVDVPIAPTSLSAKVVGEKQIELDWVKPTDTGVGDSSRLLVKYVLQQSTSSTFDTIQATFEPAPASTNQVVTVPTSGPDPFYFRIAATNEVGQSAFSGSANEQGVTVPSAPRNLLATTPAEARIDISWDGPLDTGIGTLDRTLLQYRVEYFAEGLDSVVQHFPTNTTTSSYTNLDFTVVYTFRVYVSNDAGWSLKAETSKQPIVLPTAPVGLAATVQEALKIRLVWQRPTNTGRGGHIEPITAYIVEMDSNVAFGGNADFATVTEKARGVTFCVDTTCTLDISFTESRKDPYWFRVNAQNELGTGPYSVANEQSVQIPTAPRDLTVQVISPRTVFLKWVQPEDTGVGGAVRALGNYTLQQSYGDNTFQVGDTMVIRTYLNTTRNATVVLPSSGPTYFFFRVLTSNDAGLSQLSSIVQEQGVELPSAPILLGTSISTPLEITFSWTKPQDTGVTGHSRPLLGYSLQVTEETGHATSSTFSTLWYSDEDFSADNQANSLSKLFSGLVKGKTYFFRVAAKNDAGNGPFANHVSNDAISKPTSPVDLVAVVRRPFEIDLAWVRPLDNGFYEASLDKLIRFELEHSLDATFTTGLSSNLIASGSLPFAYNFSAPTATKGSRHFFRIWAVNEAGRSLTPTLASEEAVDVPSIPTDLSVSITGVLELTVQWRIPDDTGLGASVTPIRPLHNYFLQIYILDTPLPGSTCTWPNTCSCDVPTTFICGHTALDPDQTYTLSNTTNSYVMSGLIKGKSYFARVLANNDAGLGAVTATVNKPAVDKPNAPILSSALADRPLAINIDWDLSTDTGLGAAIRPQWPMGDQRIQIASNAAFTTDVFNLNVSHDTTNHIITGLQKGWHYHIRIFSSNMLGESVASNTVTEHAIDVPSLPLGLQVLISSATERELLLSWQFPLDTGLGDAACYDNCLSGERMLTRIRLQRIDTNSPIDTFIAGTPQPAPADPVDFSGHTSFDFNPSSGTWQTKHFLPLSYNDTNLSKGQTYYYSVLASNSAGEGSASAPVHEMAITLPTAPLELGVVISGELSLNTTWNPPLDNGDGLVASLSAPRPLMKYLVQIDEISPSVFSSGLTVPTFPTRTVFQVDFEFPVEFPITRYRALSPTLKQGRMYYIRVIAQNAHGLSIPSNVVNLTAILKPTVPVMTPESLWVSNPAEISIRWSRPVDTGAIGQYWPLKYLELQMSSGSDNNFTNLTSNTVLFNSDFISVNGVETNINTITSYLFVASGLIVGEYYHFRVFTENEAGRSSVSFIPSILAVKLSTPPANFTATVPGKLQILLKWNTPEDTGAGGRIKPISRYIVEMEVGDRIVETGTDFSLSPFVFDGCNPAKVPPCALDEGISPYDLGMEGSSGIVYTPTTSECVPKVDPSTLVPLAVPNEAHPYMKGVTSTGQDCNSYWRNYDQMLEEWRVLITGLTKARTYYFRVLALNDAGLSKSTAIKMEYGVDLPSVPLGPPINNAPSGTMVRLDIIGLLTYRISFSKPLDTGLGDQRRQLVSYGVQLEAAVSENELRWTPQLGSSTVAYVGGNDLYADVQNGVNNVTILPGTRYFVRVFAVNDAGYGGFSHHDSNGPSFDYFEPSTGPAAGGSVVSVVGSRMGDASTTYQMYIGGKECLSVFPARFQRSVGCVVPPGLPGKQGFRLFVDSLLLSKDSVFEYLGPRIESVDPSDGVSVEGGVRVSILGSNFGTVHASQEIAIASSRSDRCKETAWTSDSAMLCITSPVLHGAKVNNTVVVRVNDVASLLWERGSFLRYDVPAYYDCSREVEADCYACAFPKCYEWELARSQTIPQYPIAAGEVAEVCEEAAMKYCDYGLVKGTSSDGYVHEDREHQH